MPGGKIVGGTSAINGLIFNRGQRMDYDRWAQRDAAAGPTRTCCRTSRSWRAPTSAPTAYRGRSGPMKVTAAEKTSPFFDLFIRSAQAVGYPLNPDYSGATQYGVAMAQLTDPSRTAPEHGHRLPRAGAAAAEPDAAHRRRSHVADDRRQALRRRALPLRRRDARGACRARSHRQRRRHRHRRKLLELSGIGNPERAARASGIPVVHALPGVGENLRDHFGPTLKWTFKRRGISLAGRGRGLGLLLEIARYAAVSQAVSSLRAIAHDAGVRPIHASRSNRRTSR